MQNIRPFQLILLAIFGLAALLGLVLFATFGGFSGGSKAVGTVVIWGTLPQDPVTAGVQALAANNQQFGKVSYVEKPAVNFDANLANALASGTGPDLVIISQEQLLAEEGKMTLIPFSTISERSFLDSYLPEFNLYLTSTGTYGIPYVLDPMVLFYNQTILSSAGIAAPPSQWEALNGLATSLTKKTGSTITRSTIPFGTYTNVEDARGILSLLFLQTGTPITSKDTATGIIRSQLGAQSSGSESPAATALSFFAQFADPAKTVYTWNRSLPSAEQDFLAGDLALLPGYASYHVLISAGNPNLDFDMAPIPEPGTATSKTTYGLAYAFAIPKASHSPQGALTVALALNTGAPATAAASALSMAPALRTLLSASPSDKYASVYYPEALVAKGWLSPSPSAVDAAWSAMIDTIATGRLQISDALSRADQVITAALSQ